MPSRSARKIRDHLGKALEGNGGRQDGRGTKTPERRDMQRRGPIYTGRPRATVDNVARKEMANPVENWSSG